MALQNIDTCLSGTSPYSAALHASKCKLGIPREFGRPPNGARAGVALQGIAKLTFMAGIAAGILFALQGIALQVQKFSVRPDAETPITTMVRWVHSAWNAALHPPQIPRSTFDAEVRMSASQLINRWTPLIGAASQRFSVPASWIRAVVQIESGGRTMSGENKQITSRVGAMGLMQLMPGTYAQMRREIGLGADAYNSRDNVFAGAAYLRFLYQKYGYPAMFAAYNDGPGHLEERLMRGRLLPQETRNYINRIFTSLNGGARDSGVAEFTKPNGAPVTIQVAQASAVRAPLPGEYAPVVQAVITVGHVQQAVRETVDAVKSELNAHGAVALPLGNGSTKLADLISAGGKTSTVHQSARTETHTGRRKLAARIVATARHPRLELADAGGASTIRLRPISHHYRTRG